MVDLESSMYEFIERWLRKRYNDPCIATTTEFHYDFANRSRRADVIGMYLKHGSSFLVGVEAKRYEDDLGKALRQARRLQSFCHETYVAIPKSEYTEMSETSKQDYLTLFHDNRVGLLLVMKRGLPETQLTVMPSMFHVNRYRTAIDYFSEIFGETKVTLDEGSLGEEECAIIHKDFIETAVWKKYDFLKEDWEYGYDNRKSWIWGESGGITIESQKITFSTEIEEPNEVSKKILSNSYEVSLGIARELKKLNAPTDWSKRGLMKSPELQIYYTRRGVWYPRNSKYFPYVRVNLGLLVNEQLVFQLGTFLKQRSIHYMQIEGELSRSILVYNGGVTDSRHYAEDLRDFYDVLYCIGRFLSS